MESMSGVAIVVKHHYYIGQRYHESAMVQISDFGHDYISFGCYNPLWWTSSCPLIITPGIGAMFIRDVTQGLPDTAPLRHETHPR